MAPQLDPAMQRDFAIDVVKRLRHEGFAAYWAGGCVRDQLLGRPPKDFDVATSARPEQIRHVFGARRTVPVGAAFGVVTVLGPRASGQIEVATFREDAAYSDGRHPDAVAFSTPEADAQRRDFTINGLFYDPIEDRVIDFVGGQDDLARGIVRAIGQPEARFAEDKLRLLRAARFASTLGFTFDLATRRAMEAMADQILVVSAERIAGEVRLMLTHRNRAGAVDLLREVGLLAVILPELAVANQGEAVTATGQRSDDAWVETLEVLQLLEQPSFALALVALLRAFVVVEGARLVCQRWKMSNLDTRRITWLIEHADVPLKATHLRWPRLQRILVSDGVEELLALGDAVLRARGLDLAPVEHCRKLLAQPPDELNPPPLLTGDDLIAHGIPRGKQYQALLEAARDAQLDRIVASKQEALDLIDRLRATPEESS